MLRFLTLLLVVLGATSAEAATRYTTSTARGATGTACTQVSRCTNATALSLSVAGDIVNMEGNTMASPYLYQGSADMLAPSAGRKGASGSVITVRCEVAGGCLLDGQFVRDPVRLASDNDFWEFQDFNAKNGLDGVIHLVASSGSDNNVFRRLMVWDMRSDRNASIIGARGSNNIFLDIAAFGVGRKVWDTSQTGDNNQCRRCWLRWEGSLYGSLIDESIAYNSVGTIFENVLVTHDGLSMPQNGTYVDGSRVPYTNYEYFNAASLTTDRIESLTTPKPANASVFGSVSYITAGARIPTLTSGQAIFPRVHIFGISSVTLTDVIAVMSPSHAGFNTHSGFILQRRPHNCPGLSATESAGPCEDPVTNNTATRLTSIRGTNAYGSNIGDSFGTQGVSGRENETDWTVTNTVAGTSLGALSPYTPWQNTSTNGARLCYRWGTTTPLWPWPMEARIAAATGMAGTFDMAAGCPGCTWSGTGPVARTSVSVTGQIETLLGAIPSSCRTGAGGGVVEPVPGAAALEGNTAGRVIGTRVEPGSMIRGLILLVGLTLPLLALAVLHVFTKARK